MNSVDLEDYIKYLILSQINNMNFSKAQKMNRNTFFKNCMLQSSAVQKLRWGCWHSCYFHLTGSLLCLIWLKCYLSSKASQESIAAMLKQSKEEYAQIIQSKDLNLQELSRVKDQQAKKLEQIQTTIQELQNSLALEIQRYYSNFDPFSRPNTMFPQVIMFF